MTTLAARPATAAHAAPPRPRGSVWPYAGVVAALATGAAGTVLSQGQATFTGARTWGATDFVIANLSSARSVLVGAGISLLGLVATFAFLLGLTRFVARNAPLRGGVVEAMRWSSIAFLATGAIGVMIRYIAAGGAPGAIDVAMYTREAAATTAMLADQLGAAAFLPALAVMGLVGYVAVRDRVLPRTVGVVALVLTALSLTATVVLGLPYSSSLVFPVFALVVGVAGTLTRTPA